MILPLIDLIIQCKSYVGNWSTFAWNNAWKKSFMRLIIKFMKYTGEN